MAITSRQITQTGARGLISGVVSNGATWWEDVSLTEDGTVITSADTWTWQMAFRSDPDSDATDLVLSTTDGTLAIAQAADETTLQIRVAYTALSALEGDYICDLASLDTSTTPYKLVHWGHGIVTFRNEPIWSS
jgi:hypothetical protein